MKSHQRTMQKLWRRQKGRCHYCNCQMVMPKSDNSTIHDKRLATRDHLRPKSLGGVAVGDNVRLACKRCNNKKGNMSVVEFRMRVLPGLLKEDANGQGLPDAVAAMGEAFARLEARLLED